MSGGVCPWQGPYLASGDIDQVVLDLIHLIHLHVLVEALLGVVEDEEARKLPLLDVELPHEAVPLHAVEVAQHEVLRHQLSLAAAHLPDGRHEGLRLLLR